MHAVLQCAGELCGSWEFCEHHVQTVCSRRGTHPTD